MSADGFGRLASLLGGIRNPRISEPVYGTITAFSPLTVQLDTGLTITQPVWVNGRPIIPGGQAQFTTEGGFSFEVPSQVYSIGFELHGPGIVFDQTDPTFASYGAILSGGVDVVPGDIITGTVGGTPEWLGEFYSKTGGSNGGGNGGVGTNGFGPLPSYVSLDGCGGCGATDISLNGILKAVAGGAGGGRANESMLASSTWQDMQAYGGWGGGEEYFDPPDFLDFFSGSAGSNFHLPSSTSGGHGGSDLYGSPGGTGDAYGDPGGDGASGTGGEGGQAFVYPGAIILGGNGGGGGHTGGGGGGHDASFGGGGGGGGSWIYDNDNLGIFGVQGILTEEGGIWQLPGRITLSWAYPRCQLALGLRVLCIPVEDGNDFAVLCP